MWNKKVTQIMTDNVITVNENDTLEEVYALLKDNNIHHIPVVNQDLEMLGIISYQDIVKLFHPSTAYNHPTGWEKTKFYLRTLLAKEVMTEHVFGLSSDSYLKDAAHLLMENQFHCIPILHEKRVVGMITPLDLIRYSLLENQTI